MKRILSIFLTLSIMLCLIPMGLFSLKAKSETIDQYTYSIFRGKATITSVSSKISGDVTIPSTLGGYSVTYISEKAFQYCQQITSVVIPNTVEGIGKFAFYNCDKITSVQIPNSVTSIGAYCFYNCRALSSINIPPSVTVLDNYTFALCVSLESIEIPNGVTTIGDSVFSGCMVLNSITIPDSVTSIGQLAFYLTAYYDDSSNWENDLLYIDDHLVGVKSSNKTDCTVKPNTKTIAFAAFSGYKSLLNLTIPFVGGSKNKNTHFGYLFGGKTDINNKLSVLPNIEKITISYGCTKIPKYSFRECIFIEEIIIPDSVTTIEDRAFSGCSSLKSVTVPGKLTMIDDNAFNNCPLLTLNIDANNNQAINYAQRKNIKYTTFETVTEPQEPCSGKTDVRNTKDATCCENGYTGDTYCVDCGEKITDGTVIPATGNHTDADGKWETDGTHHWHTCYYGTQYDVAVHTGGAATCTEKAKCAVCGVEYGDYTAHTLTHHDPVAPDYENNGNIEYWTCDDCGKYFSDADGLNEITADDIVIAKLVVSEYRFIDGEIIIEAPAGAIPEGALFDVQKIVPPPAEVVEKVKDQMGASSEVLAYYEIRLSDMSGELIIHLDGEITIKTKMPEQYIGSNCVRILQEDETGKLIVMESWWEGEYLCYKTDWLEIYN